ncbi:SUN domain containing protein [Gracilaria domingensis]|nr:SUN domain containing protein [Gracilaria domingensis]
MNGLVTLLVLVPTFLLAISFANSPTPCTGVSATSHHPSISTVPTQSPAPAPDLPASPIQSVPGSYAVVYPPDNPSSPPPHTQSASFPPPSQKAPPSPSVLDEQVFIPLKEWKQRKLQHIESRVRNGQTRVSASPHPSPRVVAKCQLSRRHLPIALFARICYMHEAVQTPNNISESHALAMSTTPHQHTPPPAPDAQTLSTAHTQVPRFSASPPSTHSHSSSHSQFSSSSPCATANHANIPIRVTASLVPSNLPAHDPFESDPSIRGGLNIPLRLPNVVPNFGAIVRSIMDASYLFSATPLPPSFKSNSHSSHNLLAPNNTNSSSAQQTQFAHRAQSSSTNSKRRHNSNTNYSDRSKAVETSAMDEPVPEDVLIQPNLQGAKEKPFNFASADAGARVLGYSEGVVGAKNVLIGSVDKYLLAPCDNNGLMGSRWIDLELSEDVILESIETANFEYYSSSARKVAVLGASSYPPKRWNILGVFNFRNVKSIQRFQISKRVVTRFLRVMYSGKQGDEYYCPVSTIRAFGKNLIADWKDVFEERTPEDNQFRSPGEGDSRELEDEIVVDQEAYDRHSHNVGDSSQRTTPNPSGRANGPAKDENPDQGTFPGASGNEEEESSPWNSERGSRDTSRTSDRGGHDNQAADGTQTEQEDYSRSSRVDERTNAKGGQLPTEEEVHSVDSDLISEDDRIVMEAVRTDALAPVSVEDNIFRKVTRMLRLLELNQTLTNQYIDSQLSRFAKALASTHSRSGAVDERVANVEKQMMQTVVSLEARVDDLLQASFVRDVVICLLLICLAVLIGAYCVLWGVVSGARLQYVAENQVIESHSGAAGVETIFRTDEVGSPITTKDDFPVDEIPSSSKRKKRKMRKAVASAKKERNEAHKSEGKTTDDQRGRHARSASSVELVSLPSTTQSPTPSGGAFDVLGSTEGNL